MTVITIYLLNFSVAKDIYEGNITKLKNDVITTEGYINSFAKELDIAEEADDSDTVKELGLIIEGYEKNKALKQERIKAFEEQDWETILKGEISDLNFLFEAGAGATTPPMSIEEQDTSWFTFRATLEEKKHLLDYKVVPIVQNTTDVGFLPTYYDNFTGKSLEQWKQMTKRYGVTGYSFLYQLIQLLYIPIIVLLGCLIFGNGISSESGKKKHGLHFFAVLPSRKGNVFIAKYASGLMYTLVFSLIMLMVPVFCSVFTVGIGSLDYPVLVYDGPEPNPFGDEYTTLDPMKDTFHFIMLKEYIGYVLLFNVVLVFFLYSLYFFISLSVRNPGVTISILVALIFVGMSIYQNEYNPFTYIDIDQIITREKAVIDLDSAITYKTGLILLISVGFFATVIGYIRFKYSYWKA